MAEETVSEGFQCFETNDRLKGLKSACKVFEMIETPIVWLSPVQEGAKNVKVPSVRLQQANTQPHQQIPEFAAVHLLRAVVVNNFSKAG